jgi:Transposase DDE domain
MVVHRKKYRAWDPQSYRCQPVCPEDRLPEDDLVFFLLDVVPQAQVASPVDDCGVTQKIPATLDSGYYSETAAAGMQERGFDPYMATKRHKHNQGPTTTAPSPATVTEASLPEPVPTDSSEPPAAKATAREQMQAKLDTPQGRKLYAQRKTIVEPVFGQIKGARGFRRFLLEGLRKIKGEWCLVCLTHNLLKRWRYRCAHAMS